MSNESVPFLRVVFRRVDEFTMPFSATDNLSGLSRAVSLFSDAAARCDRNNTSCVVVLSVQHPPDGTSRQCGLPPDGHVVFQLPISGLLQFPYSLLSCSLSPPCGSFWLAMPAKFKDLVPNPLKPICLEGQPLPFKLLRAVYDSIAQQVPDRLPEFMSSIMIWLSIKNGESRSGWELWEFGKWRNLVAVLDGADQIRQDAAASAHQSLGAS